MSEPGPGPRVPLPLGIVAGLVIGLAMVACRKAESRAPTVDLSQLSLAEIEAELDRNGEALAEAGIMVASASPRVTAMPPYESAEPDDGRTKEPEVADDDEVAAGMEETEAVARPEASPVPDYDELQSPPEAEEAGDSRRRRTASSRKRSRLRDEPDSRCDRVCDLAEATCNLELQICDLATRHPDEPRYRRACLRSELQCEAADDACQACED